MILTNEQLKDTFLNLLKESADYQMLTLPEAVALYLSNLLLKIAGPNYITTFYPSQKLADIYMNAIEDRSGLVRAVRYKRIGDTSLIKLGFFPESIKRETVSKNYYRDMGVVAYEQVYITKKDPVYMRLYESYDNCIEALYGVKMLGQQDDMLALYSFWQDTKSMFAKKKLFKLGLMVDKQCQD